MSDDPSFVLRSAIHPYVPRTLSERLRKEHVEWAMSLVCAQDWPDFTSRRGFLNGLERAIQIAEEIEKELNN